MTATTAALQCQGCYQWRQVTKYIDPDGRLWWLCEPCREYNIRQDKAARADRERAEIQRAAEDAGQSTLFTDSHPRPAATTGPVQEAIDL
jgi:hypothetical protein